MSVSEDWMMNGHYVPFELQIEGLSLWEFYPDFSFESRCLRNERLVMHASIEMLIDYKFWSIIYSSKKLLQKIQ